MWYEVSKNGTKLQWCDIAVVRILQHPSRDTILQYSVSDPSHGLIYVGKGLAFYLLLLVIFKWKNDKFHFYGPQKMYLFSYTKVNCGIKILF